MDGVRKLILPLLTIIGIGAFIFWGFGPNSYGEKATIWDYGHGEGTHRTATEEQINNFYAKVMTKPPNKRGGLQKYRKKLMRYEYGYEYESDAVWDKAYKKIIREQTREWKAQRKKR